MGERWPPLPLLAQHLSHRAFVIAGLRRSNAAKADGQYPSRPPAVSATGSDVRIPILAWRSFLECCVVLVRCRLG